MTITSETVRFIFAVELCARATANGDGHPDLTWQNSATGQVLRWLMGGTAGTTVTQYGGPLAPVADTHWQIVGGH